MTMPEGKDGPAPQAAELLLARGWSVAVAESCTGGLIMKRLTDAPGSSRYLTGGVVAYADRIKISLLGVDPALLRDHGAVSREVARAMALGAAEKLGVDVGLSITGIAGPGGAVPGKPVGTVWIGCAIQGRTVEERVQFSGSREEIRDAAASYALDLLARAVAETN
jgi:PncC family amidohydrolase